ncbi:hypothetical protein DRO61_04080 [Candidatus Bathyarchaeota archaeon]|nr:MAG: hypothetical protein DRO61_04080 [Candidatus Bathyarchaeota archaeon]
MKTIDEELHGQCVMIDCPNCHDQWHQEVIEGKLLECRKKCGVNFTMEMLPLNDVYTTFMVNPNVMNAAVLADKLSKNKIDKDLTSIYYAPKINIIN